MTVLGERGVRDLPSVMGVWLQPLASDGQGNDKWLLSELPVHPYAFESVEENWQR